MEELFVNILTPITLAIILALPTLSFADSAPSNPAADLAAGINRFGLDLYPHAGDPNTNLIFSPYSIHLALDIAAAGARGNTLSQMQSVLHLTPDFSAAASALISQLQSAGNDNSPILKTANALWAKQGEHFNASYLDSAAKTFSARIDTLNFDDPEAARKTINDWVAAQTNDKITDLIAKGIIQPRVTRLIITNAVYFKADWTDPFDPNHTHNAPFHIRGQSDASPVPTMHQTTQAAYMENDSLRAIELPYASSKLAMLLILPKNTDGLVTLESKLSPDLLSQIDAALEPDRVAVSVPKFKIAISLDLASPLIDLGMKEPFQPYTADFSGMDDDHDLYITGVVHQAYVAVDEKGTEAAAATGITVGATMVMLPPPKTFNADHPFLFLIRDKETGLILFMGRVVEPSQ
jgi:serpin B